MNTNRILCALLFVSLLVTSAAAASQLSLINYTGPGYYFLNGRYQFVSSPNYTTYQSTGSIYYNLLVNTSPLNVGTVTPGSGSYLKGTSVIISETPKAGYSFVGWTGTGTGSYTGAGTSVKVTINNAITEIANFRAPVKITVQESPAVVAKYWIACVDWIAYNGSTEQFCAGPSQWGGIGTIANATVPYGTTTSLIYVDPMVSNGGGYSFMNWSGSYSSTSADIGYNQTITGPTTIQANYQT